MAKLDKDVNSIGKGWFIARLAIDYGLIPVQNIDFGSNNSKKTRENKYKNTKGMHYTILKKIVNNWNNNIRLLNSPFTNSDLYGLALKLLNLLPPSSSFSNISGVADIQNSKIYDSYHEHDHDAHHVRYDSNVPEDERVEGLARSLEDAYEGIRSYARDITIGLFKEYRFEPIPVILKQGHPTHTYKTDNATIAKLILDLKLDNTHYALYENIISILNKEVVKLNVVGQYCGRGDRYIVLYYENTSAKNRRDLFLQLKMTLAHEYMHYVHHKFVGDRMFFDKSANRDNVIEAIADFFSAMYMGCAMLDVDHNKFAQQSLDFWIEYYGFSIPYVHALDFLKNGNSYPPLWPSILPTSILDKFLETIYTSKYGMEDAFKKLIS